MVHLHQCKYRSLNYRQRCITNAAIRVGDRPPSYIGPIRRASTSFSNQASLAPDTPVKESSWSKFEISTKKLSLSSGFPYDDRLSPLRVSHEEWFQFSSEIGIAAKLTPAEDWAAWTAGITTGTFALPFLLVFAPTVGYKTGKSVHRKAVQSNVQKKLIGDGDLRNVFRKWNQNVFAHKGFQAWLEMPSDEEEIKKKMKEKKMKIEEEMKKQKKGKKMTSEDKHALEEEQETLKRFRILVLPYDGMDFKPSSLPMSTRQASIPNFVEADANQAQTTTPNIPSLLEAPTSESRTYEVPVSEPEGISPSSPMPSSGQWASTTSPDRPQTEDGGIRHEMADKREVRHEMAA
jgi:hypothetical protein